MYKIEAIVKHQRLDAIQEALFEIDVAGITTTEVRGTGRRGSNGPTFRGTQYSNDLTLRLKVEVIVTDEAYEEALEAFTAAAQTGEVGDGKIFVTKLHDVVRIRTGERGVDALE